MAVPCAIATALLGSSRFVPSGAAIPTPVDTDNTISDSFSDPNTIANNWTQFSPSGCSCPRSLVTPPSGNTYAAVASIGGVDPPESVMVRQQRSCSDCYVQCTIANLPSAPGNRADGGLVLRAGTSLNAKLIALSIQPDGTRVNLYDPTVDPPWILLKQINVEVSVGDQVRVELDGNTMTVLYSGATKTQVSFTDSRLGIGSGYCGLRGGHHSSGTGYDDYESGNLP